MLNLPRLIGLQRLVPPLEWDDTIKAYLDGVDQFLHPLSLYIAAFGIEILISNRRSVKIRGVLEPNKDKRLANSERSRLFALQTVYRWAKLNDASTDSFSIHSSSDYISLHLPRYLKNWLASDTTANIDILKTLPFDDIVAPRYHAAHSKGRAYKIASAALKAGIKQVEQENREYIELFEEMDPDDEFWMKRAMDRDT